MTDFLQIELRDINSIKPYERNPRINDKAVSAVALSLREFGFRQPIVVDSDGTIIAGHTRYKAALKLGLGKVPVHVATDLTPEQAKAYRIADNKTGEIAEWDLDIVPQVLTARKNLLENIKTWLETNILLQSDFPEVCYPIKCLERISNRQKGQKYLGVPTRIEWSTDKIVLPTIKGSRASGVVISSSGMHGSEIRGQHHARPDGQVVRPQLVLIDDPQTTESAWSWSQSQRRESILAGDVLGMAGPGKKIAGLMACTVIRPDDMASRILDREKHPDWQGERTKMVYAFPLNEKLWARYNELRSDSLRNDGGCKVATEFYREHREAMDDGAQVAWADRFNPDELSAVQHAQHRGAIVQERSPSYWLWYYLTWLVVDCGTIVR